MIFKTKTIEQLYDEANDIPVDKKKTQKDIGAISLADIVEIRKNENESVEDVVKDIVDNKIKVDIDKRSVEILRDLDSETDEGKDIIAALDGISKKTGTKLNIDISSMSQLDMKTLEKIESYCSIGKVYLNNGWDETAKQGNTVSRYKASLKKAKEMLEAAGVEDGQESQVKFDKIYKYVVEHAKYDYNGQGDNNHTSRGLEGFFIKNEPTGVCAGLTLGTMCLCQMAGIEDVEYVNGKGKMPGRDKEEMHSWFRVKIDGEWTNCDISWDLANRNSKLNDFVFKQISDERFYKGGMHKADLKYNPTYIRSRDVRYQDYDEERNYEESTTSHNSLKDKEIKDLFFTEREIDIVRNTGINWFKGLKSGLANTAVVLFGTNIGGKRFNEFLLANNTLGDDEVKTALHKRKTFLKKQQERKEEEKAKKQEEKTKKKENNNKEEKTNYKSPDEMTTDEINEEINSIKQKLYDELKLDLIDDGRTGADLLRYARAVYELEKSGNIINNFKGKYVDRTLNASAEKLNDLNEKNESNTITDKDIEQLAFITKVLEQFETTITTTPKYWDADKDGDIVCAIGEYNWEDDERVSKMISDGLDSKKLEAIILIADRAMEMDKIAKKEIELGNRYISEAWFWIYISRNKLSDKDKLKKLKKYYEDIEKNPDKKRKKLKKRNKDTDKYEKEKAAKKAREQAKAVTDNKEDSERDSFRKGLQTDGSEYTGPQRPIRNSNEPIINSGTEQSDDDILKQFNIPIPEEPDNKNQSDHPDDPDPSDSL